MCRTGVDNVEGPIVDCEANQCLNTSSPESTVYSCDYSRICDMMKLENACVKEGDKMTCCCFATECNVGDSHAPGFEQTVTIRPSDSNIQPLY
uniref:Uncharacterized protein n=1 Tax=Panagrolaimus sp. JU765 TaxID=591449 RepID=A0AC34Q3N9_9BILA